MSDAETEKIAAFIMAKSEAERLQDYVNRGRSYQAYEKDRLQLLLVQGYRDLADDVHNREANQITSDVAAEYTLRGEEPPFHLASDSIDRFAKAVVAGTQKLGEERLAEINDELLEEYAKAKKHRN